MPDVTLFLSFPPWLLSTALMMAAARGATDVLAVLVAAEDVDLNAVDHAGQVGRGRAVV